MVVLKTRLKSIFLVAASLLLAGLGCSSKLDTGYEPTPLSASVNARRAYYAQPFSPEAAAAGNDQKELMESRRAN